MRVFFQGFFDFCRFNYFVRLGQNFISASDYIEHGNCVTAKSSSRRSNVLGVRFWYTGIRVKSLEESMKFYKEAFDFRILLRGRMKSHEGTYVQMRTPTGKQILELNYYPETSKFYEKYASGSELDHLGFYVSNVREQYKRLVGLGCESAVEPFNEGSWVLAFVKDPNGVWLELIGRESKKKA